MRNTNSKKSTFGQPIMQHGKLGPHTTTLAKRTLLGAALIATLSPFAAATQAYAEEGNTGTTQVTVIADQSNLRFRVPTIIPFVAASDGTLTGPSADVTRIENLSVFGIKVTNVALEASGGWSHADDISSSDNSICWAFGPESNLISAARAAEDGGLDIANSAWNMTYHSDDTSTDDIYLKTEGAVGRVVKDISSPVQVGTITFTVAAGAHATEGTD